MLLLPELCYVYLLGSSGGKKVLLSIHSPLAHFCVNVSCCQCLPQDEHITLKTLWMRASDLIHDENGLLNVPLHNIHPEVGAIGAPPWENLNYKAD